MLLAALAVVAGAIAGRLLGGRFGRLAGVRLRASGLLVAGAICQVAGSWWASGWPGWALLVAGYVALLAFAAANVARTGMVLVAVGLVANLTVITVDRGMPVRGVPAGSYEGARHHGVGPGDRLTALGDDIHVAALGETLSPGDVVLSVGVAAAVAGLLTGPRRRPGVGSVTSDA